MEHAMRSVFSSTAIGLALAAAAVTAAHAQTVITPDPVVTVPAATVVGPATETVQTTETVRTIRPLRPHVRRVVTTRTITRQIVPAPTIVARTVSTAPRPIYDEVVAAPLDENPRPLYDSVAAPVVAPPGPVLTNAAVVDDGTMAAPAYRYVYEPDRILVVDPTTGIAVQSIPR
jgi:hypothetical protein